MICEIDLELVLPIRKQVLWPEKSIDFVRVDGDEDAVHFGYFKGYDLLGVVSIFQQNSNFQFRKLAVSFEHQGIGLGTKLVEHLKIYCESLDGYDLWCNARVEKLPFYGRMGFVPFGEVFKNNSKSYQMMVYKLRL